MMDLVEAPEERDAMGEDVPDEERVVEERDRERRLEPGREADRVHEAPSSSVDESREPARERAFRRLDRGRAEHGHAEVPDVATELRLGGPAERTAVLEPCDR